MFAHIRFMACWLGVLAFSTVIALPADAQNDPFQRNNTSSNRTLLKDPIIRVNPGMRNADGTTAIPYSSRINELGWITTPRGEVIHPNVGIRNGDGSTTYYYPNGARITVDKTKLPAAGAIVR
jgi:hypothetical protein